MLNLNFLILIYFLLAQNVETLKILMFQAGYGISHIQFSNTLADILVNKGHIVVCFFLF